MVSRMHIILIGRHVTVLAFHTDRIPADANRKMRMEKCGKTPKKVKRMRREIRMAKISKQTKERNLSFKSLSHGWDLHVQNSLSIVGPGYPVFFLNSLNPVIPFINVTETRALRSSSLKPRMLWYTSPLST